MEIMTLASSALSSRHNFHKISPLASAVKTADREPDSEVEAGFIHSEEIVFCKFEIETVNLCLLVSVPLVLRGGGTRRVEELAFT
jgi:hypothetical protein